uniref:hypothetical protein n=1 Tax=Synechococcus sp. UW106 TaxID=368495 RepID=UPI0014830A62|nr:hypothetical protein [Synechococcus sp. UW106]
MDLIEALRDRLAVAELGATFLGGLVGDVSIPNKRQELVWSREEPTVWPQPWITCWI